MTRESPKPIRNIDREKAENLPMSHLNASILQKMALKNDRKQPESA